MKAFSKLMRRKKKCDLKEGHNFTVNEKGLIIKAIEYAREQYKTKNVTNGLCAYLRLFLYAEGSKCIYVVLRDLYHNPNYYRSEGLETGDLMYWWELSDKTSRLKALDILERAILND